MKILAIRGQNLASLARTFEIDLANGPLRDVGLFAITGPVGAGKSTLLDALCLALFDRTPRLPNRGGVPVGDAGADRGDWLRSNDVRTLLRRDAAEGFAEVDFTGRDRRRYRARWSVRRARRRSDGRVQDQEMSLVDLDRSIVVAKDRKTEVLAAIEQRLGLDFGQFCRSVLLAQGEFAAFLHSNADERARLLENLTGADVYRKLSRAAHARRKAEAARVETLRAQFDAQELLDPGARAALEGECAALGAEVATCGAAVEVAQRYVTWHRAAADREREEAEATVELRQAQERDAAAAPRRARLARLQAALALLPHWKLVRQRRQVAEVAAAATAAAARALAEAEAAEVAARRALQPVLREAFGGDGAVPPVVRDLPRHEPLLRRRVDAEARLAKVCAGEPEFAAARDRAAAALPAARERVRRAAAAQAEAVELAQAAERACAAPELEARTRRRNAWTVRRAALQQVVAGTDAVVTAAAGAAQAAAALARQTAARDRLVGEFAALVEVRDRAEAALQAARRTLEHVRAAAGLEALRAHLVAGEPCPLCGSHEHPAAGAPAHDAAASEREAHAAQRAFDDAVRAVAEHEARRRHAEDELAAAARAAAVAAEDAARARRRWDDAVAGDAELAAVGAAEVDAVRAVLARRTADLADEERALDELDARAREHTATYAAAVRASAAAQQATVAAQDAEQQAARAHAEAGAAVDRASAESERLRGMLAEQAETLAGAFTGVPDWTTRLARQGGEWLAIVQRAHDLDLRVRDAEAAVAAARQAHADAVGAEARAVSEAVDASAALASAVQEASMQEDDVAEAARAGAAALAAQAEELAALQEDVVQRRAVLKERVAQRKKHAAHDRPSLDAAEAGEALELARARRQDAERQLIEKKGQLAVDDRVRRQRDELAPRLETAERTLAIWQALDDLIGSSDGSSFVVFAQGLTLDLLLIEANQRLAELARRYRLERNPGGEMDFVVVDLDMGGSRRGLRTLSGGETFLVSLALALALATLAAPRSRVETLFLDEGFGTLDAQNLETALGALDALQATGCQVGVISHVEGFAERIGAAVEVRPAGGGRSRVLVHLQ